MLSNKIHIPIVILLVITLGGCKLELDTNTTTFIRQFPESSNIQFSNRITENDTFNILNLEYVYNGGGVGAGDFNNDGLIDLFFSANNASSALYLNQGNFIFKDVTSQANIETSTTWNSGVSIVDINGDGKDDIYLSSTILEPASRRANLLFINQGTNQNGVPRFRESAKEYGLADESHTTSTVFFDYDRDGDLDCYVLINQMDDKRLPNLYVPKIGDGTSVRNDRLYRNDFDANLNHPVFTDVTQEAGILKGGYGLGVTINDFNKDGWPDIYVANDYLSNDLCWINNQDGTFTDRAPEMMEHTSYSAMGVDVADLNNDLSPDVITLDMMPGDNLRRKTMIPSSNFNTRRNNDRFGYQYQYMRNVLQLNRGKLSSDNELPIFSEIGLYAGVAATDWSWSILAEDVDLDGNRDLLITNGFPRDITNLDFMDYSSTSSRYTSKALLLDKIPEVKISNFAFRNDGHSIPTFKDATREWGLYLPSFSSGAITVDLDNDGDLDYVVNQINDSALVYQNTSSNQDEPNHYLTLELVGNPPNTRALGALISVDNGDKTQRRYLTPYRGYLSSLPNRQHFGFGTNTSQVEIHIQWPDGSMSSHQSDVDTLIKIRQPTNASINDAPDKQLSESVALLTDVSQKRGITTKHQEDLFVDFDYQRLLTRQLSQHGPCLAVGDANADGLEDLFIGGASNYPDQIQLQLPDGTFASPVAINTNLKSETTSAVFFDADNDGDDDLYIAHGSVEAPVNSELYQDQLLINDNGKLVYSPTALPDIRYSSSVVCAGDVDGDGDQDLFVGGRSVPGSFPIAEQSALLLNDGSGRFASAKTSLFDQLGMVTDAILADFTQDGRLDLVTCEDYGKLLLWKGTATGFGESPSEIMPNKKGCWVSLYATDLDLDGNLDLVAGNLGRNNLYHQNEDDYVAVLAGDFDGNNYIDAIPATRFFDSTGNLQVFPFYQRQELQKQVTKLRSKYPFHSDFSTITAQQLIEDLGGNDTASVSADYLLSVTLRNNGDGTFDATALPRAAQLAPIFGITSQDLNGDRRPELLLVGNDYGTEVRMGRYDAFHGLVLNNKGDFSFEPLPYITGGLTVPGDAKALVTITSVNNTQIIVSATNQGPLKAFEATKKADKKVQ